MILQQGEGPECKTCVAAIMNQGVNIKSGFPVGSMMGAEGITILVVEKHDSVGALLF